MPDDNDSDFNEARAEVFEAIGHPTRIRILNVLGESPMTFSELKKLVGIESSGHLEFHLRKLAHLITTNKDGAYLLTDDGREAVRIIQSLRSEGTPAGSPPRAAGRGLFPRVVVIVLVALLAMFMAIPTGLSISIGPGGAYRPLIGLFVAGIAKQLLPAGWIMISNDTGDPIEIYFAASLMLALLFASPLVAFKVVRVLGPALAARQRMTYSLVVCASALLAVGALFGYYLFSGVVVGGLSSHFDQIAGGPTFVNAVSFYLTVLGTIAVSAVVFTLPVYILVRARFGAPSRAIQV